MITVTQKGDFKNTEKFLNKILSGYIAKILSKYGEQGVNVLSSATPVDSGATAAGWYYEIVQRAGYYSIVWHNRHSNDGQVIAILIQYGHGTGTGGYVQGRDYINPAVQPLFDKIADDVWKEVTS
jgi:hypothetical protein